MLRALAADFKAAGHSVATILDSRLVAFKVPLQADCTAQVASSGELDAAFEAATESAETNFVIAPESAGVLEALVRKVERFGSSSLNCNSAAIHSVANKPMLLEHVKRLGIQVPKSLRVHIHETNASVAKSVNEELGFPAILKPANSTGCSALSVVNDAKQIETAIAKIRAISPAETFLAQELILGTAASVSIYSNGQEALPVSLNQQSVTLATPDADSSYDSGVVPLKNPFKGQAFSAAKRIVESIRGVRGYLGVDMVLTEDGPIVIEVNPRLTTSYVGLRMVSGFNLAEALTDSVLGRKLPVDCDTFGYSYFAKVKTPRPSQTLLEKSYKLPGVFAPPFPIANDNKAFALVIAHGETLQSASLRLERNKRCLKRTLQSKGEQPRC